MCSVDANSVDKVGVRLNKLAKNINLPDQDIQVLELLLRYGTSHLVESLIDDVSDYRRLRTDVLNLRNPALPLFLGRSKKSIEQRLTNERPLIQLGLVAVKEDGDLEIPSRLNRLASAPRDEAMNVTSILLDVASPSELKWTDFDHAAHARDFVEKIIAGALSRRSVGVNILVYGPPGTGKTEFCKVLAQKLGAALYCVGEQDESGDEPSRHERLQELRLAQRLLSRNTGSLLLFDEMDDLMGSEDSIMGIFDIDRPRRNSVKSVDSKVFMHRLLERTPVPTLWVMNDAHSVDPTILRRMMFALELGLPNQRVRARVWKRQLERHGVEAAHGEIQKLSREFQATPGVAAGATVAASLTGGGVEDVRHGVRSLTRVLGNRTPPETSPGKFLPELIHADVDPTFLANRIVATKHKQISMVLRGPPGTGKSAYVRYVAERLNMEVLQKRTSDLLSPWVGETEANIAWAFAEARDREVFLVFDEADSLLSDRRHAHGNWEVSQVNEMLTWMESHPLPFACTTNFDERLDPATLRRFIFKIELDYLTPKQIETAFQEFFSLVAPTSLMDLNALTPGDFSVVERKAEILGCRDDANELVEMLVAECTAKPDRPQPIGFR